MINDGTVIRGRLVVPYLAVWLSFNFLLAILVTVAAGGVLLIQFTSRFDGTINLILGIVSLSLIFICVSAIISHIGVGYIRTILWGIEIGREFWNRQTAPFDDSDYSIEIEGLDAREKLRGVLTTQLTYAVLLWIIIAVASLILSENAERIPTNLLESQLVSGVINAIREIPPFGFLSGSIEVFLPSDRENALLLFISVGLPSIIFAIPLRNVSIWLEVTLHEIIDSQFDDSEIFPRILTMILAILLGIALPVIHIYILITLFG